MIKLIGLKRIFAIVALLALNLLVVSGYLFKLDPMLQETQMQLNAVNGQISELSGKIANIKQEMAYLKENMPKYQELQDKGIFQNQDRFMIERVLENMRRAAALQGFSFMIEDAKDVPNADAAGVGYRLVNSRINVKISASPLDTGIYTLLQDIASSFSGHTHIKSFELKRIAEVKEQALNDLLNGKPVGFINADIVFDWMTMAPKAAAQPLAPAEGAAAGFRGH